MRWTSANRPRRSTGQLDPLTVPWLQSRMILRSLLMILTLFAGATAGAQTRETVGVELVLAVDTSISVSRSEYRLQMQGIAEALRHPDILQAVADHPGGVAVTLVHWSLGSLNRQAVGWRHLRDAADVLAFAQEVETAPRIGAGRGTSISDAIVFATRLFAQNDVTGRALKIDISGDSRHNSGPSPEGARDLAVLAGVTINGLVIEDGDRNLAGYYRARVIGGADAFVMSVSRNRDFAQAMRRKLARELAPVAADQPPKGRSAAFGISSGGQVDVERLAQFRIEHRIETRR